MVVVFLGVLPTWVRSVAPAVASCVARFLVSVAGVSMRVGCMCWEKLWLVGWR